MINNIKVFKELNGEERRNFLLSLVGSTITKAYEPFESEINQAKGTLVITLASPVPTHIVVDIPMILEAKIQKALDSGASQLS